MEMPIISFKNVCHQPMKIATPPEQFHLIGHDQQHVTVQRTHYVASAIFYYSTVLLQWKVVHNSIVVYLENLQFIYSVSSLPVMVGRF